MENKIYKHVARHRVGYLMAAVIAMVGGLSLRSSVPNFDVLDNTSLTGNVGQLAYVNSSVSVSEDSLSSAVLTTGDELNIQWKSVNNTASLYLVPVNSQQKTISLQKSVIDNNEEKSFVWQVPDNIATGEYYLGLESGGYLDKTDQWISIVNTAGQADGGVAVLQNKLVAVSNEINAGEEQLATLNAQINMEAQNLSVLQREAQKAQADLNTAVVSYQTQKATLSTTAYREVTAKIYNLNRVLNQKNLAVKSAEAKMASLEAQAQALEANISKKEAVSLGLQGEITEMQGGANINLNASLNAFNADAVTSQKEVSALGVAQTSTQTDLATISAQLEAKENEVLALEVAAEKASAELEAARLELNNAQNAVEQALSRTDELTLSLQNAQNKVTDLNAQISAARDESTKVSLQGELKAAQDEVSKYQEMLISAQADLNNAYERLSTGKRINAAKDDAAGLAQVSLNMAEAELSALTTQLNVIKNELSVTALQNEVNQTQQEQFNVISNGASVSNDVNVSNDFNVSGGVSADAQNVGSVSVTDSVSAEVTNETATTGDLSLSGGVSNGSQNTRDASVSVSAGVTDSNAVTSGVSVTNGVTSSSGVTSSVSTSVSAQ